MLWKFCFRPQWLVLELAIRHFQVSMLTVPAYRVNNSARSLDICNNNGSTISACGRECKKIPREVVFTGAMDDLPAAQNKQEGDQ